MVREPRKNLADPMAAAGPPTPGGCPTDSLGAPGHPLKALAHAQQSPTSASSGSGGTTAPSVAAAAVTLARRA